jgi:hypothetical protein
VAKKRTEEKPKEYTRRQLSHAKQQKRRQRIILYSGIAVIVAVILLPLIGWFVSEYIPMHKTVMEINGVKFNMTDYIETMRIARLNDSTKDSETLSGEASQYMAQGEVMKQGAAKLGVTVSANETKNYLKQAGLPQTRAFVEYFGNQLLAAKLQSEYFGGQVPAEATQVSPLIMMLESDTQAREISDRLASGDNFTMLASKYALNYYSENVNQGNFGMHVREVLKSQLGTEIPLDYAFSAGVNVLSQPLTDNETYKHLGYWLIKLVDRPGDGDVVVQALFVSDKTTALDIKARLEAGTATLADMADKYTQYSLSKQTQGQLGEINISDNGTYTKTFNGYVFNPASPLGVWSVPIPDIELWTQGGSWLVKVLEREENKAVSAEDRNFLITQAFNDWYSNLSNDPNLKMDTSFLTDKMIQWAINRFDKKYPASLATSS